MRLRFFHRGIIPLLTPFFSASGSQKTAVTPLEDSGRCHSACRPLRGDQFPGDPRWLSGQAGTFFPLIVLPRRNLTLRQTHLTFRDCQGIAPRRGGGSVPWRPPMAERVCGHLLPSHSSAPEESHAPANPPASWERQRIAPRRGAFTSWARSLSRLRACGFGMSADFERKLLPAGAGGFPISWGYDKISAGAVGARFYTNKSGAKENHLCRELWVWPGRPLQNMI